MKILLVGGTGVLSTDIRELSVKQGHDVYILNRGKNKNKNNNEKVNIIIADIRDIKETKEKLKDYYFDVVIDFLSFNLEQLKGTLEIFENRCEQFIFISSATAYRKTQKGEKITEDYKLKNENWEYANNKRECEEYLKENFEKNGQKYTIVRPYVTYSDARIPFAIIPHDMQWTLANRILNDKPVVLWDNGQAICTLTSTKDFAVGMIGLFLNEKAYNEAFHITTDYTLTWYDALQFIGKALDKKVFVANIPSEFIVKEIPELKGVLLGDKGLDREFDNSKIKSVVPEFNAQIKFEDGIKDTIKFYKENNFMQEVDYAWDAQMDDLIEKYQKENPDFIKNFNKLSIKLEGYKEKLTPKNKMMYLLNRNECVRKIYSFMKKIILFFKKIVKRIVKLLKIKKTYMK